MNPVTMVLDTSGAICALCTFKIRHGQRVIQFDCNHYVHSRCEPHRLDICPICRRRIDTNMICVAINYQEGSAEDPVEIDIEPEEGSAEDPITVDDDEDDELIGINFLNDGNGDGDDDGIETGEPSI